MLVLFFGLFLIILILQVDLSNIDTDFSNIGTRIQWLATSNWLLDSYTSESHFIEICDNEMSV